MDNDSAILNVSGRTLKELRESVENERLQRVLTRIANADTGQALGFNAVAD
jgi:hypothetical protein